MGSIKREVLTEGLEGMIEDMIAMKTAQCHSDIKVFFEQWRETGRYSKKQEITQIIKWQTLG